MGDYSMVNNSKGDICGIWLRDSKQAKNENIISMLLLKEGANNFVVAALSGNFRIVQNSFDEKGGVFIMFNSAQAPGEDLSSDNAQSQNGSKNPNRNQNISNEPSQKKCAICGEAVDQDLLQCPSCGKGTFETPKENWYYHGSLKNLEADPGTEEMVANENIFGRILRWFRNIKHSAQTKMRYMGSLEGLAALAGEGNCPFCGRQMEKDQLGLRCENGHDVVCRNALFSEYTTPSEAVARELRARGVGVVVIP